MKAAIGKIEAGVNGRKSIKIYLPNMQPNIRIEEHTCDSLSSPSKWSEFGQKHIRTLNTGTVGMIKMSGKAKRQQRKCNTFYQNE